MCTILIQKHERHRKSPTAFFFFSREVERSSEPAAADGNGTAWKNHSELVVVTLKE